MGGFIRLYINALPPHRLFSTPGSVMDANSCIGQKNNDNNKYEHYIIWMYDDVDDDAVADIYKYLTE